MPIGKFTKIIATNRKVSQFAEDSIFSIFLSLDTIVHDVVKKKYKMKKKNTWINLYRNISNNST